LLAHLILKNNPENRLLNNGKNSATIVRWAKDIDAMFRIDSRSPEQVQKVIEWCQQDPFWSQNILSGSKLREKYDTLVLKTKEKDFSLDW
jgi:hypothetical protein